MTPASTRTRAVRAVRSRIPLGAVTETTSPRIVLTFDDGPSPGRTDAVLSTLAHHGATGTFFVLMTRVRRHPELIGEIIAGGHEVALHGPDHRAITEFSSARLVRRTDEARRELESITGSPVRWFRPPYGTHSLSSVAAVRRAGLTTVLWSATTWDWKAVTHAERIDKALAGGHPGAILLSHDGAADALDGAADDEVADCDTAALLDEVLDRYRRRDLHGTSLGSALAEARPLRSLRAALPRPGRRSR